MPSVRKGIKVFLRILLITIVALLGYFMSFGPKYAYRVMVWQDSDYDDYLKFKSVPIKKAAQPFEFISANAGQESQSIREFQQHPEVQNMIEFMERTDTYAFLIIKNDTLLFEYYAEGNDRTSLQTSFSTAKSFLSVLIGLAIEDNYIRGVNDRITRYLPELRESDGRFKNITIEDLLRMRSSIAYSSETKFPFMTMDAPRTYYHPDLRKVALEMTEIDPDLNGKFHYNNYNALLLGLILERATNRSISNYMEERLWKRIGTEFDASWSTDEHGFEKMESGLNARAIDFAKMGRLILNNGQFEGEQILKAKWVDRSTQPIDTLSPGRNGGWGYSYMWWSIPQEERNAEIFANGRYGQFIYISPDTGVIIIRHGLRGAHLGDYDWTRIFSAYAESIYSKKLPNH